MMIYLLCNWQQSCYEAERAAGFVVKSSRESKRDHLPPVQQAALNELAYFNTLFPTYQIFLVLIPWRIPDLIKISLDL